MRRVLLSSLATLAVACGVFALLRPPPKVRFADLALGPGTSSLRASVQGDRVHCAGPRDAGLCLEPAGERPVVLWLGNSQLHGVNQLRPGQENAAPQVHRALRGDGLYPLTFSQANANLQEHLVLLEWLRPRARIDTLVLALCFDDLRETGLRPGLRAALEDPEVAAALADSTVGLAIAEDASAEEGQAELAGLDQTVQQRVEAAASDWLGDHFPPWGMRRRTRSGLLPRLYRLRNRVFGVEASSMRRMIPSRRARNMAALEQILRRARDTGLRVTAYVVPIRHDLPLPYAAGEYARFKEEVRALTGRYGAEFANLETLVPAQAWGQKAAIRGGDGFDADFMHFQAAGHALLAKAIITAVRGTR